MLKADGAVAAYSRFLRGGESNVTWLGPAFFTKLLYFAGFDRTPGPQPLILDRFVAKTLGWRTTGWTATDYGTYLDAATSWAGEYATTPDVVERTLFEIGKRRR
jgi:hypothetical protein